MARIKKVKDKVEIKTKIKEFGSPSKDKNKGSKELKKMIRTFISQQSLNSIESHGLMFGYNDNDNNVFHNDLLNNVLERSDFYTNIRKWGSKLVIDGSYNLSTVKVEDNWYVIFSEKIEGKQVFRDYTEAYIPFRIIDEQQIYLKQHLDKDTKTLMQQKVIKKEDGTFELIDDDEKIDLKIDFVPTTTIRNNSLGTGDIEIVSFLIDKLSIYWDKIDGEFAHTGSAITVSAFNNNGVNATKAIEKRESGDKDMSGENNAGSGGPVYLATPQDPFRTLISTIEFIEDKIFKFMFSAREKENQGKNQKNNLEVASADQIAVEYYLHKKTQREDDLTYFFKNILSKILDIDKGNKKFTKIRDVKINFSPFEESKINAALAQGVRNDNAAAQSEDYSSSAAKKFAEIRLLDKKLDGDI